MIPYDTIIIHTSIYKFKTTIRYVKNNSKKIETFRKIYDSDIEIWEVIHGDINEGNN